MTRVSAQLYFPSRLMVHEGIRNRSGWRFQSEPAHGVVRRIVGATCSSKELVLKSPYFEAANRKSSFGCPWMGLWMMWKATCLQGIETPSHGASPTVLAVVSDKGIVMALVRRDCRLRRLVLAPSVLQTMGMGGWATQDLRSKVIDRDICTLRGAPICEDGCHPAIEACIWVEWYGSCRYRSPFALIGHAPFRERRPSS
jgi:hypothetical protein